RPILRARIAGIVFLDENLNGVYDPGEAFIPGITVYLYDSEGNLIDSVITGPDGSYLFDDLMPGTYRISIDVPIEYDLTTPDSYTVELSEGSTETRNFGLTPAPALPFPPEKETEERLPFTGISFSVYVSFISGLILLLSGLALIRKSASM
ncbi:MAG: carboxypeptidase regulatory-like domain-containing protein, partial [Actinobacteria bacterium]|nr:carboxypeptidase regulatory-like domain-containing protein [Actinomycetota bacterium]